MTVKANKLIRPALQVFNDIHDETTANDTAIDQWLANDEQGNLIEAVSNYFEEVEDKLEQSRQIADEIVRLHTAARDNRGNDGRIPQGGPSQ